MRPPRAAPSAFFDQQLEAIRLVRLVALTDSSSSGFLTNYLGS
jgi:hypothetical protein